jgi:hypothetical protein
MSTQIATRSVYVQLLGSCGPDCAAFASPLYEQLGSGAYDVCSVLPLRGSILDWQAEHRTARKRAWRAERLGYRFAEIDRHEYVDDVFEINTSAPMRQGRPMSPGYLVPPSSTPDPEYPCPLHGVHPYGVLLDEELVAYLWCYRSGDLALVSSILGHAEHLRFDVMYLLMRGTIEAELGLGGLLVYNRHDSGTEGLRYYKERCGFQPAEVAWAP